MNLAINETHDPNLRSWVESANEPEADFPIQNLPLGLFLLREGTDRPQVGVAIGDQVLDLSTIAQELWGQQMVGDLVCYEHHYESLNFTMAMSEPADRMVLRQHISGLLRADASGREREVAERCLHPMWEVELLPPVQIGDYTDFYASIHHATNIGKMLRPDQPLMPNYKWMPIGYHGRASSIVVSGDPIHRPNGQTMAADAAAPVFGPSRMLDYELEVGCFVAYGANRQSFQLADAETHLFGLCLVNDWSARDIQRWEYQPLGPFLSKSFATTISPWIVTLEALAPFRAPACLRPPGDPAPLAYLDSPVNREYGGFDIELEVLLSTTQMRAERMAPHRMSTSNTRDLYWTFAQMFTHHTSNGCNMLPGDLLASGTVSGPAKENQGCLMELTERGALPIALPTGEQRRFLEDGDEVILRGHCARDGFRRIGFGECRGVISPSYSGS
jgi:fumarylacetoacetase